jgi:mTERF domain-containing protein
LLRAAPHVLLSDPDKIIRPKLRFFDSLGVGATVLAQSNLITRSLDKFLVPCVEFLRGIVGTDANLRTALTRRPCFLGGLNQRKLRPAVENLRRHGLSDEAISKLIVLNMGVLGMAPNRIAVIFEDLEALGLPITDPRFVGCFACMSMLKRETIWRRMALYQCFGLSQCQVARAVMTQPQLLNLTDGNIQRKLLFFQDELKIALPQVIALPKILTFSVEKNILPKCAVLSLLMREWKIQRSINLLGSLGVSAKDFSERYVKKYEKDLPDVVRAYEGKLKFEGFMAQDIEPCRSQAPVF